MTGISPRRQIVGTVVTAICFAFVFAYPVWSAIGNLLFLPDFYLTQLGVTADKVPWALLWAGVGIPLVIFALGVALGWRRGPGAVALMLTVGFAVVSAIGLDIVALDAETRLRLVVEFLNNS